MKFILLCVLGFVIGTKGAGFITDQCITPDDEDGECVYIKSCKSLMDILGKPVVTDLDRYIIRAHGHACQHKEKYAAVCCPISKIMPPETATTKIYEPAVEDFSLPQPPYCGTVSTAQAEFDSGSITYEEEYPWTAMLLYKNKRNEKSHIYCGGTLIHERFVLTAAHCLHEQEPEWNLTGVRLRVWATTAMEYCQNQETSDQLDCESKHIDMVVSKIIKHPEHESLYNDLALLQLNAAVRATRYIAPICLPLETRQFSASFDNTAMQISGWGAHIFGEIAEVKMKSITYISNMEKCKKLYSNGVAENLTAQHVCVKGKGTDDGKVLDSGGALMAVVNVGRMQSYFLVGVEAISYEVPPEKGYPFIFTRVSPYLDWIKSEIIEKDRDLLPTTEECGKYDAITNRIIGGAQTGIEEYPWTALLLCANEKGDIAINCGGSLINKYYVITAAHCTKENEYELFKVRLGDWHITEDKDCDGHLCGPPERTIEISINNILRHPRYNPRNLDYDVALLRLKDRVEYTRFIKPICLPMDVSLRGKRYDGNSATIVGWGLTEMNQLSDIKLKATVQIIYGNNGKKFRVRDSKIYATGNGNDSCRGDSGGPLMIKEEVNENKNWYLIGIISYGNLNNTCGTEESIGIYARVSSFLDWINDTIRT
ncbi:serine protease easter isoform X1 [Zeugodacus cucurbitae]|uniref:serine protease easter isoform X1 n=1 Tax=Zeugodacus cucurbitae TaxID=28588 RepID=UPI0023D912FF|nr:serine protease easter isoform X1 [Zeugodacus cucurbitae]